MKSCFGILLLLLTLVALIGAGGFIWYLSGTAEFSRKGEVPVAVPRAIPVR